MRDVAYWHKADIEELPVNVCYWGVKRTLARRYRAILPSWPAPRQRSRSESHAARVMPPPSECVDRSLCSEPFRYQASCVTATCN